NRMSDGRPRILAPLAIPEVEPTSTANRARARCQAAAQHAEQLPRGVCPELPARREHPFLENHKLATPRQCATQHDFLTGIKALVKATHGVEVVALRKEEAPRRQSQAGVHEQEH